MIAITPQVRVLVAIEPADFRCGIDGLSQRCRSVLNHNPFAGTVIVFRNRAGKAIKLLVYDGQGFWLCYKRMSQSRFRFWPSSSDGVARTFLAHELQVLIPGGDPLRAQGRRCGGRSGRSLRAETIPALAFHERLRYCFAAWKPCCATGVVRSRPPMCTSSAS